MLLADPGGPITEDCLSDELQIVNGGSEPPGVLQARTSRFEREEIVAALERAGGVKTKAAEELGIT